MKCDGNAGVHGNDLLAIDGMMRCKPSINILGLAQNFPAGSWLSG